MATAGVENKQSIYDLAIQEYGSVEGIFNLMNDNQGLINNLNYQPQPGTILKILSSATNDEMLRYVKFQKIKPSTGVAESLTPLLNVDDEPLLNIQDDMLYNLTQIIG